MMTSLKEFGDGLTYKDIIAYADMGGLFSAGKKGILLTEEMIRNSSHQKVLLKEKGGVMKIHFECKTMVVIVAAVGDAGGCAFYPLLHRSRA